MKNKFKQLALITLTGVLAALCVLFVLVYCAFISSNLSSSELTIGTLAFAVTLGYVIRTCKIAVKSI